jgi:hypothetical protein
LLHPKAPKVTPSEELQKRLDAFKKALKHGTRK